MFLLNNKELLDNAYVNTKRVKLYISLCSYKNIMENRKFFSISIQVLITLMLLYSLALAVDVDVTKPWHYLSQIAKSRFDLTSIDSDENGRIDAGIIEDTLQDITNNGATTTHTINVGGLNSAGAIIASGNLNIGSGKLFVDVSTGRVGIGTASPTAKLDVKGDVKISGSITGSGNLNIGSGKLFVDVSTGKVGIGTTSPHGNLGIKQGHGDWITLERTAGSGYWHIHNPSTQERIEIGYTSDSGTTRWGMFVIKDNGNVGIGTNSPTAKLDVNGNLKVRGFTLEHQGADFVLGTNDGRNKGSKTSQRALVHGGNDELIINYNGDFEGGVVVQGPSLKVTGSLCLSDGCKSKWSEIGGVIDLYRVYTETGGRTMNAESICRSKGYDGFWAGMDNDDGSEYIICYKVREGITIVRHF